LFPFSESTLYRQKSISIDRLPRRASISAVQLLSAVADHAPVLRVQNALVEIQNAAAPVRTVGVAVQIVAALVRNVVEVALNARVDRCALAQSVAAKALTGATVRCARVQNVAAAVHNSELVPAAELEALIYAVLGIQFFRVFQAGPSACQRSHHFGGVALGDRSAARSVQAVPFFRAGPVARLVFGCRGQKVSRAQL